jgi:ATP-dependent Clp protease adaptor protein ClpS
MSSRVPSRGNPVESRMAGSTVVVPTLPLYHVILHRASDHGLLLVIQVLRELTRFAETEARTRMWEAYHWGQAIVLATHKERAELFVEQFMDRGLTATIEPA